MPWQSPIDSSDYEGLQLDTRAVDNTDKNLNPFQGYGDEKAYLSQSTEARGRQRSPKSTATTTDGAGSAGTEDSIVPPEPKKRRCGVRRRTFCILFGVILAITIAAAIVGGVVGGRRHPSATKSTSHAPAPAAPSPSASPANLPYVLVRVPLQDQC